MSLTMNKSQKTLTSYFNTNDPIKILNYFCLLISKDEFEARFQHKTHFAKIDTFNWPETKFNFYLCINTDYLQEYTVSEFEETWSVLMNTKELVKHEMIIPFLKSHLQKSIRRGKRILSVISAWHLMRLPSPNGRILEGILSLLRRLTIIIVEDVKLHSEYPTLLWFFIYFCRLQSHLGKTRKIQEKLKTFSLNILRKIIEYILGWSDYLAKCKVRDDWSFLTAAYEYELSDYNESLWNPSLLLKGYKNFPIKLLLNAEYYDEDKQSLIYSLFLRISYGGHDGDKNMLLSSALIWHNRFISNHEIEVLNEKIFLDKIEYGHIISKIEGQDIDWPMINENNLIPEAADFHTFPITAKKLLAVIEGDDLYNLVMFQDTNDKLNAIKNLIWSCASSVNYRVLECSGDDLKEELLGTEMKKCLMRIYKKYEKQYKNICYSASLKLFSNTEETLIF